MIEDRVVGLKSREVYECPGSVSLIEAHIALERLVLTAKSCASRRRSTSATAN